MDSASLTGKRLGFSMTRTASQVLLLRFARRGSEVVILIGALVLLGWLLKNPWLKSVFPQLVAMNPVSAILFVLSGVALRRLAAREPVAFQPMDRVAFGCAMLVTAAAVT